MIRRSTRLQLAAFALISLLGLAFVSARYVGLGDALLGRGYVVTADFAESGGIFVGAEVTYRGVGVGKVEQLRLSRDGVRVDLRLDDAPRIPADTLAVVADRSAVGEQYVDLQPRQNSGPYLHAGSQIPRSATRTPVATSTLLLDLDRLVGSVDRGDLATVVDELGRAFKGTGPDLQRLVDDGQRLTQTATDALPETVRLLDDGTTVLATQRDSRQAILTFSKRLADLADTVRASDSDLRRVLSAGAGASAELDALLRGVRPSLAPLLGNLLTGAQITTARIPGLRQVLVTYPTVVKGGFTVVPGDGTAHFGLVLGTDPPACTQGYAGTTKRSPHDTSDVPVNRSARCTAPEPVSVRGAQHAPRPGGGSAASDLPRDAVGSPLPSGPEMGGSAGVTSATSGSLDGTTNPLGGADGPALAGYDPLTGAVVAPDGHRATLGSLGGQQAIFGKDSWQWLLLGPLSDPAGGA